MDLRDLIRDALAHADLSARQQGRARADVRFGNLSVGVRVDGSGSTGKLLRMIEARSADPAGDSAVIDVVGAMAPEHARLLPPPELRGRTVLRATDDIYYLWLTEAEGYLTAIDRRSRRGLVWFTAPDKIASWHIARPLLHAIQGLSLHTAWTPIHAAAVARNGQGLLVVGQSGAGKTSIAIACALAGWDYLGDDAVIVRADPARVGALYSSARLRADTFDLFPGAMAASLGVSDDAGEPKAEVDMALLGGLGHGEADIRAILFPHRSGRTAARLSPLGRSDAIRKLMAAARQSIMGDEASTFAKLAAMIHHVPCYELDPGLAAAALPAALARLIGSEADDGSAASSP
jgi:hypothetical protein